MAVAESANGLDTVVTPDTTQSSPSARQVRVLVCAGARVAQMVGAEMFALAVAVFPLRCARRSRFGLVWDRAARNVGVTPDDL